MAGIKQCFYHALNAGGSNHQLCIFVYIIRFSFGIRTLCMRDKIILHQHIVGSQYSWPAEHQQTAFSRSELVGSGRRE